MTPNAFGPFRPLEQIGAGGLGPVFRALPSHTDCPVALKVFSLGLHSDRLGRLLNELEVLVSSNLDHLNIATPLAAGTSGASAYLAQELATGDSLDVVRRERLIVAPADVARLAADIAGTLDWAAAAGLVHGRLNPRDVLISPDGVRVTGLGIARALEQLDVRVSPRDPYAAPERIAWLPWDSRADVFSLAAMMFELLWGRGISGLGRAAVDNVGELSGADMRMLRRVFAQGLAADAADRFESATDFAAALECACAPALSMTPAIRRKPLTITGASSLPNTPETVAPGVTPLVTLELHLAEDNAAVPVIETLDSAEEQPTPLLRLAVEPSATAKEPATELPLVLILQTTTPRESAPLSHITALAESIETEASVAPNEEPMVASCEEEIAPPVVAPPTTIDPIAAAAMEEMAALWKTPDPAMSVGLIPPPATPSPRGYSPWWAVAAGPALGAALGYLLVPTFDRYRGEPTQHDIHQPQQASISGLEYQPDAFPELDRGQDDSGGRAGRLPR